MRLLLLFCGKNTPVSLRSKRNTRISLDLPSLAFAAIEPFKPWLPKLREESARLGVMLELACWPVTHINCSLSIPAAHKARNGRICF